MKEGTNEVTSFNGTTERLSVRPSFRELSRKLWWFWCIHLNLRLGRSQLGNQIGVGTHYGTNVGTLCGTSSPPVSIRFSLRTGCPLQSIIYTHQNSTMWTLLNEVSSSIEDISGTRLSILSLTLLRNVVYNVSFNLETEF